MLCTLDRDVCSACIGTAIFLHSRLHDLGSLKTFEPGVPTGVNTQILNTGYIPTPKKCHLRKTQQQRHRAVLKLIISIEVWFLIISNQNNECRESGVVVVVDLRGRSIQAKAGASGRILPRSPDSAPEQIKMHVEELNKKKDIEQYSCIWKQYSRKTKAVD